MLGSWYTPSEIGKRAMVFWLAGSIGQMFSGFLQAAAVSSSKFQFSLPSVVQCSLFSPPCALSTNITSGKGSSSGQITERGTCANAVREKCTKCPSTDHDCYSIPI